MPAILKECVSSDEEREKEKGQGPMHVRGIGSVSNPMLFCSKLPAPLTMGPALFTCHYCKKTVS